MRGRPRGATLFPRTSTLGLLMVLMIVFNIGVGLMSFVVQSAEMSSVMAETANQLTLESQVSTIIELAGMVLAFSLIVTLAPVILRNPGKYVRALEKITGAIRARRSGPITVNGWARQTWEIERIIPECVNCGLESQRGYKNRYGKELVICGVAVWRKVEGYTHECKTCANAGIVEYGLRAEADDPDSVEVDLEDGSDHEAIDAPIENVTVESSCSD